MTVSSLLLPVFVEVGLTFALMFWMWQHRVAALRSRQVTFKDIALREPAWPVRATQIGNCFHNQFELPVLFYAATAFALILGAVDLPMVVLAWAFVASRTAHAAIHIGPNRVRWRGPAFILGFLIVTALWVSLFLRVAMRPT
jgi:hypothetical protein